jgi:hypothetical protein
VSDENGPDARGADETGRDETPRRFRTLRFNPLREVLPYVAIALGIFHTVRAATGVMDPIFLTTGPILIVIGVAAIFIFRWMKKRGL